MNHSEDFESILHAVHTYQVDAAPGGILRLDSANQIDEDMFLDKFYVAKYSSQESRLLQQIRIRQNVVCLFGQRGCGKTSLLRSIARKLRSENSRVIILDIKTLWLSLSSADRDIDNPARYEAIFTLLLRDALLQELWPNLSDRDALHAWLLAGPEGVGREVFVTLNRFVTRARYLSTSHMGEDHASRAKEILKSIQASPHVFDRIIPDLCEAISPAQLARVFSDMNPGINVTIIYDNVDRIPRSAPQKAFLRLVNDFQLSAAPAAASVIGIRPETLYAAGARSNQAGDIWNVHFLNVIWPGFGLDTPEEVHLGAIIGRRHDYLNNLKLRGHQESYQAFCEAISRLHARLMPELVKESLIMLVNGNLRAANSLYAVFMPFLIRIEIRHPRRISSVSERNAENHIETLLYYWIREEGPANDIPWYDFEKDSVGGAGVESPRYLASVEHLIMSCLLNLHSDQEKLPKDGWEGWPPIQKLVQRVEMLGFSKSEIDKAIESMDGEPGEPSQLLEREDGRLDRIRLTPAGRHMLINVYNKVGFIWAPALRWHKRRRDDGKDYFDMSTTERIEILADYLGMRAQRHLKVMANFRDALRQHQGADWIKYYRTWFGIGSSLQIERLLDSSDNFYAWHFQGKSKARRPFLWILKIYRECLAAIIQNNSIRDSEISSLWKRCSRRQGLEDVKSPSKS